MRYASVLLPTIAVGLAACADVQNPSMPKAASPGRSASNAVPSAVGTPAKIVYSNFGPRLTFDSNPTHGWLITGYLVPDVKLQAISQQFTPIGDYTFAAARVALSHVGGWPRIQVFLHADAQGLPGPLLEAMVIDTLYSAPAVYVATSTLRPALENGVPYWLTVAPGDIDVVAAWNWNVIGDESSTTIASIAEGGPWVIGVERTRSAFQIEGRPRQAQGPTIHRASGGGTMFWEDGRRLTYSITAQQMADGSVSGSLLFHAREGHIQLKGTVTCLGVIDNRAYISGDITTLTPQFEVEPRHFALALEDNGEGSTAAMPDRVTVPRLYFDDGPKVGSAIVLAPRLPCPPPGLPFLDWVNGNAQVR